jgi:CPA2 family monovalent cation:H+ antiporter-2
VDRNHVYDLWYAGCRDIIRETYDSSLRMGRSAVEALGYSREQAERVMMAFQEVDRKGMLVAAQHYDPAVPAVENEAYLASISQMRGDWEAELAERARSIMAEPKAGKA